MNSETTLTIIYVDHPDLIEIRIDARSDAFTGSVDLYEAPNALHRLASAIVGFPSSISDNRSCALGAPDEDFAGGAASFDLRCINKRGTGELVLKVRQAREAGAQSAIIIRPVSAAQIDQFVTELMRTSARVGDRASLPAF